MTIDDVTDTFRTWMHLPDAAPLLAVLGAVAANRLDGDPVWLVLVGPPGGGKSEILQSLVSLPEVHPAATLTEAALLSGSPKREKAKDASGGLLRALGTFGILLHKDLGSVFSMDREARARLLAAMREIYDGSWTRLVGTDGGRTLSWQGKVGLVAGCTPTIDRHHAVMGAMGERFLLFRLPTVDGREQTRSALRHVGREATMRAELSAAVVSLFEQATSEAATLENAEVERLVALASFVVRARSAVERDGYTRDVELIPEPEAGTRLVKVLERLLAGLTVLGTPRDEAWRIVGKAGLDSIPALRLSLFEQLHRRQDAESTTTLAEAVGYPTQTARRSLEDLAAHGLADRTSQGRGKPDIWALSQWARACYADATEGVPEMSESANNGRVPEMWKQSLTHPHLVYDDISGKVSAS